MKASRLLVAGVLVLAAMLIASAKVEAQEGIGGDVVANDSGPASEGGGGGGGSDSGGPPLICPAWEAVTVMRNGGDTIGGYRNLYVDANWFRTSLSTGVFEQRMERWCTQGGADIYQIGWVRITDPDPRISIPETVDEVRRRVAPPSPDLSPRARGVVNLGMWLAVAEPLENPVTARASAAPGSWAETSATLESTTFDFGNGDVVVCDGVGDPIPNSAKESIEPSPTCGYTVREPGTLSITVTSTWAVVSTTSRNTTVVQPDIVLSTTFDYRVIEIQTVGQSG